jgi:hypothetical protein
MLIDVSIGICMLAIMLIDMLIIHSYIYMAQDKILQSLFRGPGRPPSTVLMVSRTFSTQLATP